MADPAICRQLAKADQSMDLSKVVFTGQILPGFDPEAVRSAVAKRLRLDAARIERMFSGAEVVLRREMPHAQAYTMRARLEALGMEIRLERLVPVIETDHLSLVDDPDLEDDSDAAEIAAPAARSTDAATMECPKCGQQQPSSEECRSCGIFIRKYLEVQSQPTVPASTASGPGPRPPAAVPSSDGFRQASHKEALMGSWKVIAPVVAVLLVGWKFINRLGPDDYTIDDVRYSYEQACVDDPHCMRLLDSQWDGCVARADFSRYEDAPLTEKLAEFDAFNERLDACIVDENGEQMFYPDW